MIEESALKELGADALLEKLASAHERIAVLERCLSEHHQLANLSDALIARAYEGTNGGGACPICIRIRLGIPENPLTNDDPHPEEAV